MTDRLVSALRDAGCVYAEEEAGEIRRVLSDPAEVARVVSARRRGVPLEQALGRARYLDLDVVLGEQVFVPRRRTEVLVEHVGTRHADARTVVDLGCGSGVLAAALTRRLRRARVFACDVDPTAVEYAGRNAETFGFTVYQGNWWDALPPQLRGTVDVAVAYLPHVPTGRLPLLPRDFRAHEPAIALDGGADGLDPFRAVVADMDRWLAATGVLWTLLATGQVAAARKVGGGREMLVKRHNGDAIVGVRRAAGAGAGDYC